MSTIFYQSGTQHMEKACEAEEQIWFEHQQQQHGESQHCFAWKLDNRVDSGRLVNALTLAQKQIGAANLNYDYDDARGLVRRPASVSPGVTIQAIHNEQQASEVLLRLKETPFDLASTTPLLFHLFIGEDICILGIVVHDILLISQGLPEIMQTISAFYNGQDGSLLREFSLPGSLPFPAGSHLLSSCTALPGHVGQGVHLRTTLPISAVPQEQAFSVWLAGVVLALSEISGQARISLWFEGDFFQNGTPTSLTLICTDKSSVQLAMLIERHVQGHDVTLPQAEAGVPLRVRWQTELSLQGIVGELLPLPPGHTRWPLTVAFKTPVQVEIIAGAQLAGWVAEYLLFRSLQRQDAYVSQLPVSIAVPQPSYSGNEEVRQRILEAFREALAMPEMGENDDFFDFGGHSLIATRIIGRLKRDCRIEININDLFSYPTAAQLAAHVKVNEAQTSVTVSESSYTSKLQAPLSLAQQSLWKIYKALGFSEAFNIPFALRFLDAIDEEVFRQAFSDILVRHAGLRSLFVDIGGEIHQQVIPPALLSQYEWFWASDTHQKEPLDQALKRAAGHHFELDNELPIRITFFRDEKNGQQVVSLLFHHIVLDEWSVNLLMDELSLALKSRSAGRVPVWKNIPLPFHVFALQQHEKGLNDRHLRYWLDHLHGVSPAMPIFAAREQVRKATGSHGNWVECKVEGEVAKGLYHLAKQQGASLFNVVYSGIAAALHLLGNFRELTIGTSASGRNDPQFFDTIGYFTTVVAHRIQFTQALTINALIDDVKRQINDSMPYTDIPIDLVEEALFGDEIAQDSHIFEVFIQIHAKNKLNGAFRLADDREVRFRQVDPEKTESVLGLQFEVMEEQIDGKPYVRVMLSYRAEHYSPAQVDLIARTVLQLFAAMAGSVGGPDVTMESLREKMGIA
ncbi:condensation domain-containing protein [Escherichia coli]|uniref:Condensation domain-containing protein n=1 Tax=Escherichia coli TaxID=562 RepID=A0AAP6AYI4_ECOLX|nr:condensation domain-containing protein [Escherichia coli]EED1845362.1 chromosome condensation protein [Escherichia coli]ELP0840198.1 chromosome condensation protein [Escherichia coli]MCX8308342.1 condensation domain-containing protein [Escherichia coli]MCX8329435.1 condensation domain-containing protein [Escherichia coli]MCX8334754.1 condensation domain-containing protein [Escherichia coli]